MSDRGAFDMDAGFNERTLVDTNSVFKAWETPLRCAVREAEAAAAPGEPAIDLEAIREAAFAEGFAEGCRMAEAELAPEREAIAALTTSIEALQPQPPEALAAMLAATVERLVHQIVGEVPINPILLVKRAEAAAAMIGDETEAARLLVNPADLPLFARTRVAIEVAGDPAIERGGLRVEWGRGCIEDGPTVRLERLRASLEKLAAPE